MKRVSYTAEFAPEAVKQVIEWSHGRVEAANRVLTGGEWKAAFEVFLPVSTDELAGQGKTQKGVPLTLTVT